VGLTPWWGEALTNAAPTLREAGPVVRGGSPVAELVANAAATLTLGWLLLSGVFLPSEGGQLSADGRRCLRYAAFSAAAWTIAAFALTLLDTADLVGTSITDAVSSGTLLLYFADLLEGRALLIVLVIAATISVAAHLARTVIGTGYLFVLAVIGITPPLFAGHAAESSYHFLAVYTLMAHVVGSAIWVGGLAVMLLSGRWLGDRLSDIVPRYSAHALACFAVVGISGLVSAWIRLGGFNVDSSYGHLVVAKSAALAGLAAFGWWQLPRSRTSGEGATPREISPPTRPTTTPTPTTGKSRCGNSVIDPPTTTG
jgi:putative copper export protein